MSETAHNKTKNVVPASPGTTPVIFGEVLFDHFPDASIVAGGAPFNVAWHLAAFGLKPLLISALGADREGSELRKRMSRWGLRLDGIQENHHSTGRVQVDFKDEDPQFTIVENCAYDFIKNLPLPRALRPALLYHGSLALRTPSSYKSFTTLQRDLQVPVFLDVNLRSPWWHRDKVIEMIKKATWIKLNHNELQMLTGTDSIDQGVNHLQKVCGPRHLIITLGAAGAMVVTADEQKHEIHPQQKISILDPVGAGDAFSSVLILGLLKNWTLAKQLSAAQDFAEALLDIRGATTTDHNFYHRFCKKWEIT